MLKIVCVLSLFITSLNLPSLDNKATDCKIIESVTSKYSVGDTVKCSQWENSYWEGKVVKVVKDVLYQVQLENVHVEGAVKVYLNPSECTGKKRLSFEDGKGYYETKIWVHERCLD